MGTDRNFSGGIALALTLAICCGGCMLTPDEPRPITRVVLMWLKRPGSAADRAQLIRGAKSLRMIPGVMQVETGRTLPEMNQPVDRSFDLAVVITLQDRAALARFEKDPRHRAAVARYLKPLVRHYEIYNLGVR
jgi:hypothetical protein